VAPARTDPVSREECERTHATLKWFIAIAMTCILASAGVLYSGATANAGDIIRLQRDLAAQGDLLVEVREQLASMNRDNQQMLVALARIQTILRESQPEKGAVR